MIAKFSLRFCNFAHQMTDINNSFFFNSIFWTTLYYLLCITLFRLSVITARHSKSRKLHWNKDTVLCWRILSKMLCISHHEIRSYLTKIKILNKVKKKNNLLWQKCCILRKTQQGDFCWIFFWGTVNDELSAYSILVKMTLSNNYFYSFSHFFSQNHIMKNSLLKKSALPRDAYLRGCA